MGIIEKVSIDNSTFARLSENAKRSGRTLEQEAAEALRVALRPPSEELVAMLDKIAGMTPKGIKQTDSTILVREDRDR